MNTESQVIDRIKRDPARSAQIVRILAFCVIAGGVIASSAWLQNYMPVLYLRLSCEDFFIEFATSLCWLLTGLLIAIGCYRYASFRTVGAIGIATLALLIGMEEISWGQRIFDITTPDSFSSWNSQNEITLHNAVELQRHYSELGMLLLVYALGMPVVARWGWASKWFKRIGIPVPPIYLVPMFIVCAMFFRTSLRNFTLLGAAEWGEFQFSFTMLLLAVHWVAHAKGETASLRTVSVRQAVCVAAVFTLAGGMTAAFQSHGTQMSLLRRAATAKLPHEGMHDQALVVVNYLIEQDTWRMHELRMHRDLLLAEIGSETPTQLTTTDVDLLDLQLGDRPDYSDLRNARTSVLSHAARYQLMGRHDLALQHLDKGHQLFLNAVQNETMTITQLHMYDALMDLYRGMLPSSRASMKLVVDSTNDSWLLRGRNREYDTHEDLVERINQVSPMKSTVNP